MDNVFYKVVQIICVIQLSICNNIQSQSEYKTTVKLTDLKDEVVLKKMQSNATALLTELNSAYFQNREPILSKDIATNEARESIRMIWETSPLRCTEAQIVERVLKMKRGTIYQIRNIPVYVKNVSNNDVSKTETASTEKHDYEICLVFNSQGQIENVFYSLETTQYTKLLVDGSSELDLQRREYILEFIEKFRTAYNKKDIDFLEKIYGIDNSLLGNMSDTVRFATRTNGAQQYQIQTIAEHMKSLKERIFKHNKYVNIQFDSIKIVQDWRHENIYGVNLKQTWMTSGYRDVGYLFLMIDFSNETNPAIIVRTWQPESAKETKKGIYNLGSFEIIR
ncbi:MAG: hypothetical protein C0412_13965 [Flavobacterium sp.]|nr:hypothetical protein [Flavobacterium sp.]